MGGARVLVIGLDAAERSIVLDLVAAGRMPHVGALLERGHHAAIDAPEHVFVGAAWPTLFTGTSPACHGRWAAEVLRRNAYETERCERPTAVEPFWAPLARDGLQVAVIDVPMAQLVELPNVVQLAEWQTHDSGGPFSSWIGTSAPALEHLDAGTGPECDDYHRLGQLGALCTDLVAAVERKKRLAEVLLRHSDWDLLFVVFGESHCVGHQAWHQHDTAHPLHDRALAEELGDPIVAVYAALDAAVGELVDLAGRDTTVTVLLSHGMGPHYDGAHLMGEVLQRIED